MTAEQIREFIKRRPFESFTIHTADGAQFKVTHPEALVVPPGWSTTAIVTFPKDRFSFVYLKNVTHVSSRGPLPNVSQRKRRDENDSFD
jgi:hypothetical protein